MRAGTLAILLVQVSAVKFWNRMVDSNSNTLRDVMKADISLRVRVRVTQLYPPARAVEL